jgi:hypothetical protein
MSKRRWFAYGFLAGVAYGILRNPVGCLLWLGILFVVGLIVLWIAIATIGFDPVLVTVLAIAFAEPWEYPAFTFKKDDHKSVQFGPYRYIEYEDGSTELYDHRQDPNEWTNLAENPEQKQVLQQLRAMFTEFKTFDKKLP